MTSNSLSVGLPFDLDSAGPPSPVRPRIENGTVHLHAGPGADLFKDPDAGPQATFPDAERFVASIAGDFAFSAFVEADMVEKFDSGVLLIWVDLNNWAKICVEQDTQQRQRLVSVVTRGQSDDANGPFLTKPQAHLRIMRKGEVFGLQASQDGKRWDMLRYFGLGTTPGQPVSIGVLAQSPAGPGCDARFSDIKFSSQPPADFRAES